jgi:VWFA-related protein
MQGGDLSYGNLERDGADWFLVESSGQSRNVIKDLGRLDWIDRFDVPSISPLPELPLDQGRLLIFDTSGRNAKGLPDTRRPVSNLPNVAKVILGHMYAIRVVNLNSDFYVLVHVDALVLADNCTISWKILSNSSSPKAPEPTVTKTAEAATNKSRSPTSPVLAQVKARDKNATLAPVEKPTLLNAESETRAAERPRLKAFGSSLDRLRWETEKQAAVEIDNPNDRDRGVAAEDVVRVETRLVVSNVLVLDEKGRAVEGLKQDDFVVTEDGAPQPIGHFSLGDNKEVARSVVLLFDYSDSLLPYIETSAVAAKNLVDQLGPKDRMAIVTDDVELLVDFTRDKTKLKDTIDSLTANTRSGHAGKSRQFSALFATLREMFDDEDIRPIIIFQTDGDQVGFMRTKTFPFGLNDVNTAVEKSRRATIYTVVPGARLIGLSRDEQLSRFRLAFEKERLAHHQMLLKMHPEWAQSPPRPFETVYPPNLTRIIDLRLKMNEAAAGVAEISGGKVFFLEEPEQANDIYSQILSDVNQRYVIGYYPTNKTTDGKRRKVLITVRNHPEYTVEGRKSYIAAEAR